ncbi:carboxypeptidase-like regulatory domain-containing protein [Hymenobacter koreensis]
MITAVLRRYYLLIVLLSSLMALTACGDKPSVQPKPEFPTSTALSGVVLDENQRPVAGAQVQAGTQTTTSSATGTFSFSDAPITEGRCVVRVTKTGFFDSVVGLRPQQGAPRMQVTLAALGTPLTFVAGAGATLNVPGGVRITLPANGLVLNGIRYTGSAQAYVRYISPTDPQLPRLMPGGDLAALNATNNPQTLITYGAVRVELEAHGEPLQIAPGNTAELRFPAAGATEARIPLWHFDTSAGLWKEEGSATRTGTEYVGNVSHFSAWNLDMSADQAFIRGRLVDCAGTPQVGLTLRVGQTEALTDDQGYFGTAVPSGSATTVSTSWPPNAGAGQQIAAAPALTRGTVHELGQITACLPAVKGRLVDCNAQPVTGVVRLVNGAGAMLSVAIVGSDGRFSLIGPAGVATQVEAFLTNGGTTRQAAQLPTSATTSDLGDMRVCSGNAGGTLLMSFTLDGDGRTNELIELRDAPHYYDRPKAYRSSGSTAVVMGRSTQTFYNTAALQIPGTGVGTFQSGPGGLTSSLGMGINGPTSAIYYETNTGATLDFVITQYDAVGGRIKGTFSGTLRKRVGSGPLTATTVTVRNGTFDFPRVADQ